MRLEELYVDGFGHFHQRSIGPITGPVTVFYGPNEAGKSTLLAFIRAILFGFPRQYNNHYPPSSGGRHGGRITLSDKQGAIYVVERTAGRGALRVNTPVGPALDAETALRDLTGPATADLFRSVFAFSLDELQEIDSLNDSTVSGIIYSAGQGAPKFPDLRKSISDRKGQIYRRQGRAQQVGDVLGKLQAVDQQMKDIEGNAGRYGELISRKFEISEELDAVGAELSRLNARCEEISGLRSGWDDWVALEDCDRRLREMARFEQFPEDPIPRLENFEDRLRQAREDREEAAEQLRQAEEAASAVIPGKDLLDDGDRIESIHRSRNSFDGSIHDLPERQVELGQSEESLAERLRALGGGWNESNLGALDTSMTARDQVDQWNRQLTEAIGSVAGAKARLEQDNVRLHELRDQEREAQARLISGPPGESDRELHPASGRLEDLLEDRERLEQVRRARTSFDASVRDLPERRAELVALESDLNSRLRDLGEGWDEARLERFDTSIVFRQEVELWKERLSEGRDTVRQCQERLERASAELTERQTAARESRERLPVDAPTLDAPELGKQRDALRAARGRLNEYERARLNHENLRGQLNSLTSGERPAAGGTALVLPALLALAGIILIAVGIYQRDVALLLGLIGGSILVGAAVYLVVRGRAARSPATPLSEALAGQSAEAEASSESARMLLVEAARPLGLDDVPTAAGLDSAESRLESAGNDLSAWNEANHRAGEAERLMKSQEQRVEAATQQAQASEDSYGESRRAWRVWLRQRGLSENLTPDTMVEFMGHVESTRVKLEQVVQMRRRVAAIEVDIREYLDLVRPMAEKYGVDLGDYDHRRIVAVSDALVNGFESVQNLVIQRDSASRSLKRHEQTVSTTAEEERMTAEALADMQTQWRGWLRERGLSDTFTPDTMLEFLVRIDAARTSLGEARRMRNRVEAIKRDIEGFREQVAPLAVLHGIRMDAEDNDQLAEVADDLIKRLEEAQTTHANRERAKQQEDETRRILERQEQRVQSVQEELAALLEAGCAEGPEQFRLRARQHAELLELERQREEHIRSLERLSGPGDKFDAFRTSLESSDTNRLNEEFAQLSERTEEIGHLRDALREERGGIDNELAQLTGEQESSRLRTHRSTLLEQLREHAREWSRLTIAEVLLDKTRQKFERERQPSVIRHAQDFFSNMTGERYTRLYAPIGEQTITVTDAAGRSKQPSELSRGTREQLYLALRFGLIWEFGERSERLPVVVDEALVNFDSERARLAAESFAVLSQTNQVLVFTCHPATAELFASAAGAQIVDLSQPA